jgi:hypothetical protein
MPPTRSRETRAGRIAAPLLVCTPNALKNALLAMPPVQAVAGALPTAVAERVCSRTAAVPRGGGKLLQVDDAALDGGGGGLRAVLDAEFAQDVFDVVLYGVLGDV